MSVPNSGYGANRSGRYGRLRRGMDPATRRLILFASGLAGVLVCLIGASTLLGDRSVSVPVVTAESRPLRVRPDNPGGMQIDGAENDVFAGPADERSARLAPAAETPDPGGMHVTTAAPSKASMAPTSPASVAIQPPVVTLPPQPSPGAMAPEAAPGPAYAAPTKPLVTAMTAPRPASAPPGFAAPASAPTTSAPTTSAPSGSAASAAAPGLSAMPSRSPAVAAAAARRPAIVQLAALTSEQAARQEWQQMSKRMPGLLNGRQPSFSRVERDGHTFWRLRTAGFPDVGQARVFCEHVRAKGAACSIADF